MTSQTTTGFTMLDQLLALIQDEIECDYQNIAIAAGAQIFFLAKVSSPSSLPTSLKKTKWTGGSGFINAEMLTSVLPKPGQGKVFVCGPGPMLNHVSGSKAPDYSQGEVGGLLAKLGYSKDDVFKV